MNRIKRILAVSALMAISVAAFAQVDPARVVATVNGVEIKGGEYYRRMEFLPGVGKDVGSGFSEFPPGFLTLEQLVTEKLIFQLAAKKGVMPTEPEVQNEIRYRLDRNSKYLTDWIAAGRTREELEYDVKFDLAQFKILTAGITITDQEVDKFYKENSKTIFTVPKQVKLRVIAVRLVDGVSAEGKLVDQELAAGKPFAEVAKAHSVDVTASTGGVYATMPVAMLAENVRNVVGTTKIGQVTTWFKSADGKNMFRFLVEDIIAEKVQPMTPELRRNTRQRMMMDAGRMKNNIKKELDEMRGKATVDIKEKGFAEAYKRFIEAYLKAVGS